MKFVPCCDPATSRSPSVTQHAHMTLAGTVTWIDLR